MDQAKFEELIVKAAERPIAKYLDQIFEYVNCPDNLTKETHASLELLWESWDEDNISEAAALFCIEIAGHSFETSSAFRLVLASAIKKLLPPFLSHSPFMRALGLRDNTVPVNEIIRRFRKLEVLRNGTIIFRNGNWSTAGSPDSISGSLPLTPLGGRGSSLAVPMENILTEANLFSPGIEINRITDPVRAAMLSSNDFREMVKKRAISRLSDAVIKQIATASVGKKITDTDKFEAWWENTTVTPTATAGTRRASCGRGLVEMDLLLDKEAAAGDGKFSEEEIANLTKFFENLKPAVAKSEGVALAKVIAKLMPRLNEDDICEVFTPLKGKPAFWPENPGQAKLADLSVWGEVPSKCLEALSKATAAIFEEDYLAKCALRLPLKALNGVCLAVSSEVLFETISSLKSCGSDLLLWLWKNRRKGVAPELLTLVNIDNVVWSLSQDKLPKVWQSAQRELRTNLLEKEDFQKQMISSANNDPVLITSTLQGALFFSSSERQSLLVKLARLSDELRNYVENGAGQRILNAGLTASNRKIDVPTALEPNFTSVKSHERLLQELDDIINIHTPENREALQIARAHGDFRENAEFDAAKERRNYLSHRRSELERELANLQQVVFRNIAVSDEAVIGCQVELTDEEDGDVSIYYLLGAWDGNPDKNYLSYRTRLGQAIFGHKLNSKITMPNGRERIISAIKSLPEAVLLEME